MTGVHGLEHVQGLTATDLADDDAIGSHPERVPDQIADGDLAAALDVGRPGLERNDVGLGEAELGGVFDRDEPLLVRDGTREDAEQRGLAAPRTSADHDVSRVPVRSRTGRCFVYAVDNRVVYQPTDAAR